MASARAPTSNILDGFHEPIGVGIQSVFPGELLPRLLQSSADAELADPPLLFDH
jgi:hypothetical protein